MDELWRSITGLNKTFIEDMDAVDKAIHASMPSSTPSILYNASRHLIATGGKKIRPTLFILAFNATNRDKTTKDVLPIAVALELIHTATIIHDDILDRSSRRRGVSTVNSRWGNDIALIAGDLIFSHAFGLIATHENGEIGDAISRACRKLAEGQVLETIHTGDIKMTEEVYLEVIERKTASLFEASTKCGAILGGGSKDEIKALARYGHLLGIGFQMTDDVLDINAGELKLGKPIGVDLGLGKPTFIILHALKVATAKDRKILEGIIKGESSSINDIKKALKIIKNTNSIEYASNRAKSFIMKAKKEVEHLRESGAKKSLELIADYAISREF